MLFHLCSSVLNLARVIIHFAICVGAPHERRTRGATGQGSHFWLFRSHSGTSHFSAHCFPLVKLLICLSEFMEAETGGMFTSFAHRWLREMSCPETEQVSGRDSPRGRSNTCSLLLLSYAPYTQQRLAYFLIDNSVSLTVGSEEGPVAGRY